MRSLAHPRPARLVMFAAAFALFAGIGVDSRLLTIAGHYLWASAMMFYGAAAGAGRERTIHYVLAALVAVGGTILLVQEIT